MKIRGLFKRHAVRLGLSLVIVLLFLLNALGVLNLGLIQRVENLTYDLKLQWIMPATLDRRIVIVDIDERSLQALGHWPWSRNLLAQMVEQLFDRYQIDVLGFDVVFAERDESSGLTRLVELGRTELRSNNAFQSALEKLRPSLDYDQVFANSLKDRRVVLGYYFRHQLGQGGGQGSLPPPTLASGSFDPDGVGAVVASGFTANLPELQGKALAAGFFNVSPLSDDDGVVRRISMLQSYDGGLYETFGLAIARLALNETQIELGYDDAQRSSLALESIKLGSRRIPVDIDVASLIPYRGKMGSFPYVSAIDVIEGKVPRNILQGAIVVVGSTAPGLLDLRSTPVQEAYAGVEVHANLIAGIIDGKIKERPAYTVGLEFALLFAFGVLLALALPALNPLWATVFGVGAMAGLIVGNFYAWEYANLHLPLASILLMMAVLYVFTMMYGYFIESRGKRLLAGLFGQYVPPELVVEMAKDPGSFSLAGESRELTVLFSDIRDFTTISEGLNPWQLTHLMNEFLSPMTHVIHRNRGTIDKYVGDMIMAFWGAPLPDANHARQALQAAMEMIERLESLQDSFKAKGWPPIKIGVGLNTGEMTVGNMGSEFRMAYTVMGDAVNLGSRLEGLTKEYGVQIIVSEFTKAAVPDFVFRELDCVRVKGKNRSVVIYEPVGPVGAQDAQSQEEMARYGRALASYREQDWLVAGEQFTALQQCHPERYLYEMYVKRIDYLRGNPPGPSWDGAFTFVTK